MESKLQQQSPQKVPSNKPNLTGIPTQMKLDFEQRSGLSFDDVRVHYNSDKPSRFLARAYTFGTQVHIGPGQERYLSHELGHVAQQKWGMVQPTASIHGIPVSENPGLEQAADQLAGLRSETPAIQNPSGILQRMGAVSLVEMLKINGHSIRSLPRNIRGLLLMYDDLFKDEKNRMDFDHQLEKLQELSRAIQEISEYTALRCVQAIVENEIQIIGQQKTVDRGSIQEQLDAAAQKYRDLEGRIAAASGGGIAAEIQKKGLAMQKESLGKEIDRLTRFLAPTSRQMDPYEFMDTGVEWNHQQYKPYAQKEGRRVDQLSAANLMHLQEAEVIQGENIKKIREISGYAEFYARIKDLLTNRTILSHYSGKPNISVLLSKEYAVSSSISLDQDHSDKDMEQRLRNTGFVFFFLERDNAPMRENTRFGAFRYVITKPQRMLSQSWAMLTDFITAYSKFSPKTIVKANSPANQDSRDKQMRADTGRLDTKMTYLPSGATIQFERFNNILKGDHIIEGLAHSAAQQLYALYNVDCDMDMSFDQICIEKDDDLLDMVLRLFEVQIMVPKAVVPERMDTHSQTPVNQTPSQ